MGDPVVHFEVVARDAAKMGVFYSQLFGWNVNADNPMNYGIVDTASGGRGIGGGIAQADEGAVTFYVAVPDVQAALDTAVRLGGKIVRPIEVIPGMVTMAMFADPEGHVVGIVKDEDMGAQAPAG